MLEVDKKDFKCIGKGCKERPFMYENTYKKPKDPLAGLEKIGFRLYCQEHKPSL